MKNFYISLIKDAELDFEENQNLIMPTEGSLIQTKKGFFLSLDSKNNVFLSYPIIPNTDLAEENDLIVVATKSLFPIASLWTVLTSFKMFLPIGVFKRGYLYEKINISSIKDELLSSAATNKNNYPLMDFYEEYLRISDFYENKNIHWLNYKAASDIQVIKKSDLVFTIASNEIKIVSLRSSPSIVYTYLDDNLFDILLIEDKPINLKLESIDPEDFAKNLDVVVKDAGK